MGAMKALIVDGAVRLIGEPLPDREHEGEWVDLVDTPMPDGGEDVAYQMGWSIEGDVVVKTWTPRETTEAEVADSRFRAGVQRIVEAREAAEADVPVAEALRVQAEATKAAALGQKGQVDAFVPGATYRASDLAAIRSMLSQILDRQAQILEAIARDAAWRKAVDRNAVITDDSLLWLARQATASFEAPGAFEASEPPPA